MIVYFGIEPEILSVENRENLEYNISVILRLCRNGDILCVFKRNSSQWILENLNLIEKDSSILRRIHHNYTQFMGLITSGNEFIEIIDSKNEENLIDGSYKVSISSKNFEEILRKPILLVEDAFMDISVMEKIIYWLAKKYRIPNCSFEPGHGGGSRLLDMCENYMTQNRFVLTISDSDKKTFKSICNIKKDLKNLEKKSQWPFFYYCVLPCHELENIFGLKVIGVIIDKFNIDQRETYKNLILIEECEGSEELSIFDKLSLFFDMKEGINEEKIRKLNDYEKEWIIKKFSLINIPEEEINFKGFGKNLSKIVLSSGECISLFRKEVLSSKWLSIFEETFSKLVWHTASGKKIIT